MGEPRGSGIVRHQPSQVGFVAGRGGREGFAEAIERHIGQHFGPVDFVYHDMMPHLVAVHVYVVAPTEARPHWTLVTSGMSELPMTLPDGYDISPYAELMVSLPADWPLNDRSGLGDPSGWPVRLLKEIARLPHEYGTWIGEWHSVPHGDPAEPYDESTSFAGVVITPMVRVPAEARTIQVADGSTIELLALVPLHPAEVAVKIERGTDALIEILDRGRITELLDPDRVSSA